MSYTQEEMKEKPKRIQRKRTKGWRMPENTVYVGRGSKWGNTYSIKDYGRSQAIRKFERALLDNRLQITIADIKRELKGKNLACWCSFYEPCHADVLLELANQKGKKMKIKIKCSNCDYPDEFEPDEFGLNYYQAVGTCPACDAPMITEDGVPTKEKVFFKAISN